MKKIRQSFLVFIALILAVGVFTVCFAGVEPEEKEWTIERDGMYTFTHLYEKGEQKVWLVGMSHLGEKEYFEEVEKILEQCEIVLYENPDMRFIRMPDYKVLERMKKNSPKKAEKILHIGDFNNGLRQIFYAMAMELQLTNEWVFWKSQRTTEKWISAEEGTEEYFSELDKKGVLENKINNFIEHFDKMGTERLRQILKFILVEIGPKVGNKTLTKKDFRDLLILVHSKFTYADDEFASCSIRDDLAMKNFDRVIKEKNPKSIAIKFGAAHTKHLRELLEERGYQHKKTIKFRAISFQD